MKFDKLLAHVISVLGAGAAIWQIGIINFRIYAFLLLFVGWLSFMLDYKFKQWQRELSSGGLSIKYCIYFVRVICLASILLLLGAPKVYELIPSWANDETVRIMNVVKKDGEGYNLQLKYEGKCPDKSNSLFICLRDSSVNPISEGEAASGADAPPILAKLIGSPEDWIKPILPPIFIASLLVLFLTVPFYYIGKPKGPPN